MYRGWISLYRKIQTHWIWSDKPFDRRSAWIDMLLMANHSDNKTVLGSELIEIPRGSFVTSQKKLMDRWGWSSEKLRKFLKLLESDQMIVLNPDKKKTAISILNYEVYQNQNALKLDISMNREDMQNDNGMITERKQNDIRMSAETNNNYNNLNNDNKDIIYGHGRPKDNQGTDKGLHKLSKDKLVNEKDFKEIWKSYPNKKGKQASVKSVTEILKSISKDELLRTIERYKKDVDYQRRNGFTTLQYKNGSTFFNSGYVDYLDNNYQEQQVQELIKMSDMY